MSISEKAGEFYAGLEDKFYAAMDFLSDKGIPVYSVIDPLEEKGIPAFPATIVGLLLIFLLLYSLLLFSPSDVTLSLSIKDTLGNSVNGASLKFTDADGKKILVGSSTFNDNQKLTFPRAIGFRGAVEASKEGYETDSRTFNIQKEEENLSIRLKKIVNVIEASVRLSDSDTDSPVENAEIVAVFSGGSVNCFETEKGLYSCPGLIEGEQAQLTITQPNYEQKELTTAFFAESVEPLVLIPKPSASEGKTNVIVRVHDFDSQERIGNFTLRIYDSSDNELITEITETDNDGEHVEKISKGTSIRVVVEKEDYILYDSSTVEENKTLRTEEEIFEVYLKPGTNALTVGVLDVTGRPMPSISVMLFNNVGELLDTKETSIAGQVVFENLSTEDAYYVSAWSSKYLPSKKQVVVGEENSVNLVMEVATGSNSGTLTIYTADEEGNALSDSTLNFYELNNDEVLAPLGMPAQKTDLSGKFSAQMPLNKTVVVKATNNNLAGEDTLTILETFNNEMFIVLIEPFSQVTLKILDEKGKEVKSGFVAINAGTDLLFEGEYKEGGIVFNPKGNKYVTVVYTDDEGNAFEEEVYVEGLTEVSVSPSGGKSVSGTTPEVEFKGIFNIIGDEVDGIAKGVDYYLKFNVVYPEGTTDNGFHVRIGEDSVQHVDSQDAGIIGFSAAGASSFYGRSYSPRPTPGFEALDFENSGREGEYNKWLELYFKTGGEKVVKIRVKAKETASKDNIELHYRAWSTIGNTISRTPLDAELGTTVFSQEKTSLYADTETTNVRILEPGAACGNELCAAYKFVRSDGTEFPIDNFKAVIGELYALEIDISPNNSADIQIKASTTKQKPKIAFQGFGINSYSGFPDTNSQDTSIEVDNIAVLPGETTSVRLYFKAREIENTSITLQLISGESIINEQFYFDVYREKGMVLKTLPDNVKFGENFVIELKDDEGIAIEDAEIKILSEEGEHLETLTGNNTINNGQNGRYEVKNTFSAGTIRYEIKAPARKPLDGTIEITKDGILQWADEEIYLIIKKDENTAEKFAELINNSKQNIKELTFEIENISMPEGMKIEVTPLSGVSADSKQRVVIVSEYEGDNETAHGEVRIIAKGRTETGFTVTAETKVVADYNPKINADCIEFSKKKIVMYVASGFEDRDYYDASYGTLGATDPSKYYSYSNFSATSAESFTASISNRSECQMDYELTPEIVPRGRKNEAIEMESENIILMPQINETEGKRSDTDEITINVTNKTIRNYPGKERFTFDVVYKGSGFEKSIPVEIFIWNPKYALQVSRNIELFLGPDDKGKYSAQVPLFVRNVGEADIENVTFKVSSATSRGNVDVQIMPAFPIQFLQKGQSITPPKTLVVQAIRNEKTTLLDVKEIDVTGVIDGTTFNFGPIIVTSHISGDKCLVASPANVSYSSTKIEGGISKEITLKNTCAEEVRVRGISRSEFGNNILKLEPLDGFIGPGGQATFNLVLDKKEFHQSAPTPIYVKGFLPRSGTPIDSTPILVEVKLGEDVGQGKVATEAVTLAVCDSSETKDIRFPVIATGKDATCDNAYCDAVQLSNYLVKRVELKLKDAQKQVQNTSSEVANTTCNQQNLARGFCTFEGLGLTTEEFYVYFSHDNLSPFLLQNALDNSSSLKNYRAEFFEGDAGGEYLGGYSKQIYMNSNFRGCGVYHVVLNGAVAVQGTNIVGDLMNIVIDITPEDDGALVKGSTEQCQAKIQNIGNFLPMDDGLTKDKRFDAWIGVVESDQEALNDIAKDAAKTLFGSEERAAQNVSGSNKLKLDFGNDESYVVKVEMDKIPSENPMAINAYIKEAIEVDDALQKEIAKEAAQALKDLKENVIDGCISEDESYLLLKSTKEISKINAQGKGTIKVQFDTWECADLNITSNVPETVVLKGRKFSEFDGITSDSPQFRDFSDKVTSEILVDDLDEKTGLYITNAKVCVKGNSQLHQAQGNKIVVEVRKQGEEKKKPIEVQFTLEICGIHPLKLLEILPEKKDGTYYATLVWKGSPEEMKLKNYEKLREADLFVSRADDVISGNRSVGSNESPEVTAAKTKAALWGLSACLITSAGTSFFRPTLGWFGLIFNGVFDCGPTFAFLMWGETEWAKNIGEMFSKIMVPVQNALKAGIDMLKGPIGWALNAIGLEVPADAPSTPEEAKFIDNAISAFVPANALQSIVRGTLFSGEGALSVYTKPSGLIDRALYSKNLAKEISKGAAERTFETGAERINYQNFIEPKLQKAISTELDEIVRLNTQMTGGLSGYHTDIDLKKVEEATMRAVDKVGKDPSVLEHYNRVRSSLKGGVTSGAIDETAEAVAKESSIDPRDFGTRSADVKARTLAGQKEFQNIDDIMTKARAKVASGGNLTPTERQVEQIVRMEQKIQEEAISKLKNKLGVSDIGDLENQIRKMTISFESVDSTITKSNLIPGGGAVTDTIPSKTTVKITQENITSFVNEINGQVKKNIRDVINTPGLSTSDDFAEALGKKVGSTISGKASLMDDAAKVVAQAKPKLFGSMLKAAKNLLKEGAFGALANMVGLGVFDLMYDKALKKAKDAPTLVDREQEILKAGVDQTAITPTFTSKESGMLLRKYRTYELSIKAPKESAGIIGQEVEFEMIPTIPKETQKEFILNDCKDPGFNEEIGAVFFGLLPNPDKNPSFMKLGDHALMAKQYLVKQGDEKENVRYGIMISKAVSENRGTFEETTGLSMDALIVSIGIVKSKLGNVEQNKTGNRYMFGCDLGKEVTADVFGNAVCAIKYLKNYITKCNSESSSKEKAVCFYKEYSAEEKNQVADYFIKTGSAGEEQFAELYSTWETFEWQTA